MYICMYLLLLLFKVGISLHLHAFFLWHFHSVNNEFQVVIRIPAQRMTYVCVFYFIYSTRVRLPFKGTLGLLILS